jgi:hypothetical protein
MCGCEQRQAALNDYRPGLGDRVATVAQPIKEAYLMTSKPMIAVAGFLVGAFVIPWVLAQVRSLR